jgi:hypothetical protein
MVTVKQVVLVAVVVNLVLVVQVHLIKVLLVVTVTQEQEVAEVVLPKLVPTELVAHLELVEMVEMV